MVAPWAFQKDPNFDGLLTIADIGKWITQLFFLPGDSIIYFLIVEVPELARFLEINRLSFRGFISGVISFLVWTSFIGMLLALREPADQLKTSWEKRYP